MSPVKGILLGAALIAACVAAWVEGRLKESHRLYPRDGWRLAPRALENPNAYNPEGRHYQRVAKWAILLMYLFGVIAALIS
jgi:hypothetical protein